METLDLIELLEMSEEDFRDRFRGSPIRRAKRLGLQRNACVALGNRRDPMAIPALRRALVAGEPPAIETLAERLPWSAVVAHSRAMPFWFARDLDGLETICRAAGVQPPTVLVPAWRLFGAACDDFPLLRESLHTELQGSQDIGAFVTPGDVPALLDFLTEHGSGIIKAASGAGEGAACATLLRKIRECASYAEAHGMGYLEAIGIPPLCDRGE